MPLDRVDALCIAVGNRTSLLPLMRVTAARLEACMPDEV